jgi:hypothetical protein
MPETGAKAGRAGLSIAGVVELERFVVDAIGGTVKRRSEA